MKITFEGFFEGLDYFIKKRPFISAFLFVILLVVVVLVLWVGVSGEKKPDVPSPPTEPGAPLKEYFLKLGEFGFWLGENEAKQTANGAKIYNLYRDYERPEGWVMHTVRVRGGDVGDTIAYKGEEISLYIPIRYAPFSIK
ncbi:hypothetical protein FACS1894187_21220 [Synergistales bacterium]|nr:hypothetical protein FACS1894187_21220 [Synergistales bacterium]